MQVKLCVNCKHFNRGYMGRDVCKSPDITSLNIVYGGRTSVDVLVARTELCGKISARHYEAKADEPVSRYQQIYLWLKSL